VQDERSRATDAVQRKASASSLGDGARADPPGGRIEVAEGQQVDAGAGLVVVEAMK